MDVAVNRVTNANLYIDGIGFGGRCEEIDFPKPKHIMVDHKGLGMAGTGEFWAGIDKFEMRVKWASIYAEVEALNNSPFNSLYFTVMSSIDVWTSTGREAQLPLTAIGLGIFKDSGNNSFKLHDNVDYTSMISLYHLEYYIAGVQTFLFDLFSNVYMVDGVDQLVTFRANLGE